MAVKKTTQRQKKIKSKFALLSENVAVYGLSTVINKLVPLIATPIITRILTDTADYGTYDMYNTIVHLGDTLILMGMYDALFREYFEKDDTDYQKRVLTTATSCIFVSAFFWTLLFVLFRSLVSQLFIGNPTETNVVVFAGIGCYFTAVQRALMAPIRLKNQRILYVFSNIATSVIYYLIGIVLLKAGCGYFGMMAGNLLSVIILSAFLAVLNRHEYNIHSFDKSLVVPLFKIGLPTVPALIATWVFSSVDKAMISNIMGLDQVGIYSAGAKVAYLGNVLHLAVNTGWSYFAFKTMRENHQIKMTTKIQRVLACATSFVFLVSLLVYRQFFSLYFSGDYINGYVVFPFLFLSPMILMIYMVCDSQFMVYKKSIYCSICLLVGAGVNIVVNYLLIGKIGIIGAAIATLTGYVVALLSALFVCYKNKWLNFDIRMFLALFVLLIGCLITFVDLGGVFYVIVLLLMMFTAVIFYKDIVYIVKRLKHIFLRRSDKCE